MLPMLKLLRRFCSGTDASIATTFALALIPIMTAVGAAIDYSRANSAKTFLQSALDTALIAGAKDGTSNWTQVALNVFQGNLASKNISASTPTFGSEADSTYTGSVTASVPTSVLGVINIHTVNIGANGKAKWAEADKEIRRNHSPGGWPRAVTVLNQTRLSCLTPMLRLPATSPKPAAA